MSPRENSYDSYPEYEMLLILIKGGSLMTGLQPHHYLARWEEIMRGNRAGPRIALKTRSKKLDSNFQPPINR